MELLAVLVLLSVFSIRSPIPLLAVWSYALEKGVLFVLLCIMCILLSGAVVPMPICPSLSTIKLALGPVPEYTSIALPVWLLLINNAGYELDPDITSCLTWNFALGTVVPIPTYVSL